MNNVIKRELEKVHAPLPQYDDNTTHIHIDKKVEAGPMFLVNKSYLVEIADYIINEPSNFTLSSNWNKGVIPKSKHLLIHIKEQVGKMLKVMARDYELSTEQCLEGIYFDLWLPLDGVTKIRELEE